MVIAEFSVFGQDVWLVEVEEFTQQAFALAGLPRIAAAMIVVIIVVVTAAVISVRGGGGGEVFGPAAGVRLAEAGFALDDLVEFAPVEPDAPALGAKVHLDALAHHGLERDVAHGARHGERVAKRR
jgi:hypothetical protein